MIMFLPRHHSEKATLVIIGWLQGDFGHYTFLLFGHVASSGPSDR